MKKFLINIAVVCCLFFIVDKFAYFILIKEQAQQQDDRLEKILKGAFEKELLVIGSSRAASSIDARLLEQLTGMKTLNMAYRGSHIEFQKDILQFYLDKNSPPKKILLVIDHPFIFQEVPTLTYRDDVLYPYAYDNRINNKLIAKEKHSVASKLFYLLRIHGDQLNINLDKKPMQFPVDSYGFQPLPLKDSNPSKMSFNDVIPYDTAKDLKSRISALENIKEMAMFHDIDLHFIFPPDYGIFHERFYNSFKQDFELDSYIYRYDKKEFKYQQSTYYYDSPHLNKKGAVVFTKELAAYLNN